MRRSTLLAALLVVMLPALSGVAHADADHDAKQDRRLANAKLGGTKRLNPTIQRRKNWGSDGCEATGGEKSLIYPVPTHFKIDTFQLHVRWCLKNHRFTRYSVTPDDDPWALWIHWDYGGIVSHVVNTYRRRIYTRFTASYKMCLSWLFSICREHRPWIAITVYAANRQPVIKGGWSM